jgi:hypothetical protein
MHWRRRKIYIVVSKPVHNVLKWLGQRADRGEAFVAVDALEWAAQ